VFMKEIMIGENKVIVIKKNIKNMYLRVRSDGTAVITVPSRMPNKNIYEFVFSKREWLGKAIEKTVGRAVSSKKYTDGEKVFIFGEELALRFDTGKKKGYYYKDGNVFLCVGSDCTPEKRKKAFDDFCRDTLKLKLPEAVSLCEKLTGLHANEWRIKNMKTRWGSCNINEKRIWLSLKLAERPYECLLYVICHELTHLRIKGHGKEFYSLLESFYPDRKSAEMALKQV